MPLIIPNNTGNVVFSKTNIANLCGRYPYLEPISYLTITFSSLTDICDNFLDAILSSPILKELDLRNNSIKHFSITWREKHIQLNRLWLGGNPVECGCDMIWFSDWLRNTTSQSGNNLVQDYKDIICASGTEIGTPVYMLDKKEMQCSGGFRGGGQGALAPAPAGLCPHL